HQTPTLIGCIFLRNRDKISQNQFQIPLLAAISEALHCSTVFCTQTKVLKPFVKTQETLTKRKSLSAFSLIWRKRRDSNPR
ncbi:hypothetical protein, partial [Comamonas resistens]|uniref:hypothetical protein n=1 Tax=Comamonas resistens TaxID=3046670 RepID=UPI0039BC7FB9